MLAQSCESGCYQAVKLCYFNTHTRAHELTCTSSIVELLAIKTWKTITILHALPEKIRSSHFIPKKDLKFFCQFTGKASTGTSHKLTWKGTTLSDPVTDPSRSLLLSAGAILPA